jgi:2-polyprenyl-6-methoxyphenol hydroxylase-like FAD-dependent oxidoreductase
MAIIIAGAGIGGLVAALSLHQAGFTPVVYESTAEIRPLGVGINILPHAVRELLELGLAHRLHGLGVETASLSYHSKRGQLIWSEPRGKAAGYNWPQYSIHRGRLQMMLLEVVRERMGPQAVITGHALEDWQESSTGVVARFTERATGEVRDVPGDLLIGCDGIHSRVRQRLYPEEGPPLWKGLVLWRGVTPGASFGDGRSMIMAGHADQKFVAYPLVPEGHGEPLLNWVAELRFPPDRPWRREDWNRPGKLEEFLPPFQDWNFPWLDIPALLRAAPGCHEYPMVDRDPLPRWSFGRVSVLGDAAHPMYPIGSNGASQAILDGRVLARCIRDHGATAAALSAYDEERRTATTPIVLSNRQMGPERVMQMVEERAPEGFGHVNEVLSKEELESVAHAYKRVAGFSIAELNARPSILGQVTV